MWKSTLVVISLGIDEPVRPPSYPFIHSSIHLSSFVLDTASERQNPITELCPVFFFSLSFSLSIHPSTHRTLKRTYIAQPTTLPPSLLSFPFLTENPRPPRPVQLTTHEQTIQISNFFLPFPWRKKGPTRRSLLSLRSGCTPAETDRCLIRPCQFKGSHTLTAPSHGTLRRMYAYPPPL